MSPQIALRREIIFVPAVGCILVSKAVFGRNKKGVKDFFSKKNRGRGLFFGKIRGGEDFFR